MSEGLQDRMTRIHVDGIEIDRAARIVCVVVTFNRRPLLMESLAAIRAQTRRPDAIIVVDNASSDGTSDALRSEFADVEAVVLTRNTGGAGGFAVGMAMALADGADLVWLLDDDAVAEPGALEALLRARDAVAGPAPALMASRVVWTDGRAPPDEHSPPAAVRLQGRARRGSRDRLHSDPVGVVRVDTGRCGGDASDGSAARRLLPLERRFRVHDAAAAPRPRTAVPGQRRRAQDFEVRQHCRRPGGAVLLRGAQQDLDAHLARHPSGHSNDVLYTGSTLRRWMRTFARSKDRARLRRAFARGVRAAVGSRPRPTSDVLAELGYPGDAR